MMGTFQKDSERSNTHHSHYLNENWNKGRIAKGYKSASQFLHHFIYEKAYKEVRLSLKRSKLLPWKKKKDFLISVIKKLAYFYGYQKVRLSGTMLIESLCYIVWLIDILSVLGFYRSLSISETSDNCPSIVKKSVRRDANENWEKTSANGTWIFIKEALQRIKLMECLVNFFL